MTALPRVLILSHGHPVRSPGGGEIAAHALHRLLRGSGEFDAAFVARTDEPFPTHEGCAFGATGRPGEALFHTSLGERFTFAPQHPERLARHLRDALETVRPDLVHLHHYLHFGLPALGEIRRAAPDAPIVMTLHDYQAICHNEGQMVRTRSRGLCHGASPDTCHGCFPSRSRQDFALRERHVKGWLALVDRFVAPSEFLAERYVDWGIDAARITVLENLMHPDADRDAGASPDRPAAAPAAVPRSDDRLRLAFFGRINAVKGVDLLLEAVGRLTPAVRERVRIDVHGAGLERQTAVQRLAIRRALRRLGPGVRLHGAYRQDEMPGLMREADWLVMPSRWWENSPVVILEARRHGLPVICADIGGMAEKIEHGVTGLHFRANDARALAERIGDAVALGGARAGFAERIRGTSEQPRIAAAHLELHRKLLGVGVRSGADAAPEAGAATPLRSVDADDVPKAA